MDGIRGSNVLSSRLAAALAVVIMCGCGIAPGVVQTSAGAAPTSPPHFTSEEFDPALRIPIPEQWVALETRDAVVLNAPLESGLIAERVVIFRTTGGRVEVEVLAGFEANGPEEGTPIAQPWPSDLEGWLDELDMFHVLARSEATVAASPVAIVDARSDYQPPPGLEGMTSLRLILIGPPHEGTDVTMHAGEMLWRFIVFEDRDLAMAYGAMDADYSEERVLFLVNGLTFEEPLPRAEAPFRAANGSPLSTTPPFA